MPRITGGHLRGRSDKVPVADGVRPTSDRVREALFSILGQDFRGERVLDAFGGTGMLGFEVHSRGAEVVITENSDRAFRDILLRRQQFGLTAADVRVERVDVLNAGEGLGAFTGVLADPPWSLPVEPLLEALAPRAGRWLVFEAENTTRCPEHCGALQLVQHRSYGRTTLWFYRRPDA